jgi:tetratricopeptide (TPR) repeat protein
MAISLKPDFWDAYRYRGNLNAQQHQLAAAIADYEKIVTQFPRDIQAIDFLAQLNINTKRFSSAIEDYNKIIAILPGSTATLSSRGFAYLQAKEYQLAISDYDVVISKGPNADAYLYRGEAENKLGKKNEGAADIAAAKRLNPNLDSYPPLAK